MGVICLRLTKEKTEQNRRLIVETASRLFRSRGVENVAVADLMKESGFTHGGFYNHFRSKEELVTEVVDYSFNYSAKYLLEKIAGASDPQKGLNSSLSEYLSPAHRDAHDGGCPASALPVDSARNGQDVQSAFADGIETYLDIFAAQIGGDKKEARQQAMALLSGTVGAMLLSGAVKKGQPKLLDEFLSAARKQFHQ